MNWTHSGPVRCGKRAFKKARYYGRRERVRLATHPEAAGYCQGHIEAYANGFRNDEKYGGTIRKAEGA